MPEPRRFLAPTDLTDIARERVLRRAMELKAKSEPPSPSNLRVGGLYFNSSLRTRVSWEQASWAVGGSCQTINVGADTWNLEMDPNAVMDGGSQENVVEAARVLGRYFHVLGVRAFPGAGTWAEERLEPVLAAFAEHSGTNMVSLEGAMHHPCQSLADHLTLLERFGETKGLKVAMVWAWHPRALPAAVPQSFLTQAALADCDVRVGHPEGWDLDPDVVERAQSLGQVEFTHDMAEAIEDVDVVYVKSWGRLDMWGDPEAESKARAGLRDWQLTHRSLRGAPQAKVMHCLPVRRNVVIAGDVLDSDRSIVVDQAENRLWAQAALIEELAGGAVR